jgi:hypothetical protein
LAIVQFNQNLIGDIGSANLSGTVLMEGVQRCGRGLDGLAIDSACDGL